LQLRVERTATPWRTRRFSTGGKSGRAFRCLNPHLGRSLESASSEIAQQVANLLFRAVDQMTVGRTIDRVGDLKHRPLKILTHSPN